MKLSIYKIAFIAMALAVGSIAHAQSTHDETIYVSNTDRHNLGLDQKSLSVGVQYTGANISGVCGIEIRADSNGRHKTIENFLSAIKIKDSNDNDIDVRILNKLTILFRIPTGKYVYWFSIETKDGSTLKETIKDTLGDPRTVILLGSSCL